jgi:hypothetical protein
MPFFTSCKKRRFVTKLFAPILGIFVVGKIVCVCFVPYSVCLGFCEQLFVMVAATIKFPGGLTVATRWQLSSPRGFGSYNYQISKDLKVAIQVHGCLKVARSRMPGEVMVAARVVKTQTNIIRIRGSSSFRPISHVSLCFPVVCVWFRRPGLLLSSPRWPDSGDQVAIIKSSGT